jgi:hypothetical protein
MTTVLLSVVELKKYCNPLAEPCWYGSIKGLRAKVTTALKHNRLNDQPYTESSTYDHAGRIAYLIVNPSDDPIEIDVGIPSMNYYNDYLVTDGNHRLAAAIYQNKKFITTSIGGSLEYAEELFGIKID